MRSCTKITFLVFTGVLIGWLSAQTAPPAYAQTEFPTLKVAIREIEPFAFEQNGQYAGFSIDLWEAMSVRLGVDSEFIPMDSAQALIDAVDNGDVDLGITSISITAERERVVDFSFPMFESGLQILTRVDRQDTFINTLRAIFSPMLLRGIGVAMLILLMVAHIIWITERHSNSDFSKDYLHGIWEAFYFATVTATTVGYGDKVPRKIAGRIVTVIWILLSLFLISYFTASITTALTLQQLEVNITGPDTLRGHIIGTIQDSTSASYLSSRGLPIRTFTTVEDAIVALQDNTLDAFVYDAPVLAYTVLHANDNALNLVEPIFQREDFGIVLPENSIYLENVNVALLELRETGVYDQLFVRWFGE